MLKKQEEKTGIFLTEILKVTDTINLKQKVSFQNTLLPFCHNVSKRQE